MTIIQYTNFKKNFFVHSHSLNKSESLWDVEDKMLVSCWTADGWMFGEKEKKKKK